MALLFNTLGAAAFAGFAALIILLVLQTACGIYLQAVRKRVQQHTDARVAGICDALGGMRTLKMMVAEHTMQRFIGAARAREVAASMRWSFVQAAVAGVYAVAPSHLLSQSPSILFTTPPPPPLPSFPLFHVAPAIVSLASFAACRCRPFDSTRAHASPVSRSSSAP